MSDYDDNTAACLAEAAEELSTVTALLEQVHGVRRNVGWACILTGLLGAVPMAVTTSTILHTSAPSQLMSFIGYSSLLTIIVILGCLLAAWSLLGQVTHTLTRARNDLSAEVSNLRVYVHGDTQH